MWYEYILFLWKEILLIGLLSLFIVWFLAFVLSRFFTGSQYTSKDYIISFCWIIGLICIVVILSVIFWGLFFDWRWLNARLLFLNMSGGDLWIAFAVNAAVFWIILVNYYFARMNRYLRRIVV